METIELKDVMNQLPVADLVKNLAGVDKNGVPSQFTMENIAAVVGEKISYLPIHNSNIYDADLLYHHTNAGISFFVFPSQVGKNVPEDTRCMLHIQRTIKNDVSISQTIIQIAYNDKNNTCKRTGIGNGSKINYGMWSEWV